MVMERAVTVPVLVNLTPSSSNQGLLELMTVASVTPPLPVTGVVMVSAMLVLWLREPLVPVAVTLAVPTVAVLETVKVNVLLPVVDAGLKLAVTPAGNPLAARATVPENPFTGATLMVPLPVPPCATDSVAGLADNVKSGLPLTVSG